MHGGTVHAYSEGEGKGATFVVELPLVDAEPVPGGREHSAAPTGAFVAGPGLDGVRVLRR